jgi:hypothetical protein
VETIEIRPRAVRNAALLALLSLAFVVAGGVLVARGWGGSLVALVAGALALGLGGFGLWKLPVLLRRRVSAVLTPDALWVHVGSLRGTVPWEDVEAVGVTAISGQRLTGLRLARTDRFLASVATDSRSATGADLTALRMGAAGARLLGSPHPALRQVGSLRDVAGLLAANERLTGFHLCLGWMDRDRSAEDTAALLARYLPPSR